MIARDAELNVTDQYRGACTTIEGANFYSAAADKKFTRARARVLFQLPRAFQRGRGARGEFPGYGRVGALEEERRARTRSLSGR